MSVDNITDMTLLNRHLQLGLRTVYRDTL